MKYSHIKKVIIEKADNLTVEIEVEKDKLVIICTYLNIDDELQTDIRVRKREELKDVVLEILESLGC